MKISHIAISIDEKFDTHDVTVPPSACVTSSDVCIYLKASSEERNWPSRTASSVLMAASREKVLPNFILAIHYKHYIILSINV